MLVHSDTPKSTILREAARKLEEAENLLEISDLDEFKALARDIRTLEVELLRQILDEYTL